MYNHKCLRNMADVVKWLTQRVVVPSCVGSNPIVRPNKQIKPYLKAFLFYWHTNGILPKGFTPFFIFITCL